MAKPNHDPVNSCRRQIIKFQFIVLLESLQRHLPLPLGKVPQAERAVGAGNVMLIIEA